MRNVRKVVSEMLTYKVETWGSETLLTHVTLDSL